MIDVCLVFLYMRVGQRYSWLASYVLALCSFIMVFCVPCSDVDDVPPELPLDSMACDHDLGGMDVSPELPQDPDTSVLPKTAPDPETCGPDLRDTESPSSSDSEAGKQV